MGLRQNNPFTASGVLDHWEHPIHSIGCKTHVFGMFLTISLLNESRRKTSRTSAIHAQVRYTKLRRHFPQQTHLMHSIGPRTQVLRHSGPFCYCMKVDVKLAELAPLTRKFSKRSCVGPFRNQRTRSTPLDTKLMFWDVFDQFVTARKSTQNWPNRCN
jgi:hypothetical protein